jgi:hypothetical protein
MTFLNCNNIPETTFKILSIISWLFFIATGIASVVYLSNEYEIIWTIEKKYKYSNIDCYPLQMNHVLIYMVFLINIVFGILALLFFFNKNIADSMNKIWTRLHFFPLIIVSFLFLLGEGFYPLYDKYYSNNKNYSRYYSHIQSIKIFGFCLSTIALAIFIFLYYMTEFKKLKNKWYIIFTPKKGAYSCIITLLYYYFFYSLYQLIEISFPNMDQSKLILCKKVCSILFSILFGLGSIAFSIVFKDLMVGVMNILINLGMIIYFFSINIYIRYVYYDMEYATGIIDIVIMVIQAGVIVFLLLKYKNECLSTELKL